MKKQVTNEEIGQVISKTAEIIRDDMDYAFRVAQSQMWIAENDLVDALDEKQHEAYRNYAEKREEFFKIAKSCEKILKKVLTKYCGFDRIEDGGLCPTKGAGILRETKRNETKRNEGK